MAEGKLESSESIREILSQSVCVCVCCVVFVSYVYVCMVAEREESGMMGKGVITSTAANGQYKYKHTVKIN